MKRVFLLVIVATVLASSAGTSNIATAEDQGSNFVQILKASKSVRTNSSLFGRLESSGACCKICRQGKACGDTCISQDKTCRVGPGCACDG
jgi:hypothetical protein